MLKHLLVGGGGGPEAHDELRHDPSAVLGLVGRTSVGLAVVMTLEAPLAHQQGVASDDVLILVFFVVGVPRLSLIGGLRVDVSTVVDEVVFFFFFCFAL